MIFSPMMLAGILLVMMFTLYSVLVFHLVDSFLPHKRFDVWYRLPVGLLSTALAIFATFFTLSHSASSYLLFFVVLLCNFLFFYKEPPVCSLFAASACILHVMAIRAIVVAVCSQLTGLSIYAIANETFPHTVSMAITLFFLNLAMMAILRFIPSKNLRIINQHRDQLWFITAWMTIFNLYLLFCARVYSRPAAYSLWETQGQVVSPILILLGLYLVLYFAITTGDIMGYKEKNEELRQTISSVQQYQQSILGEALMVYECDFTANLLTKGLEDIPSRASDHNLTYDQTLLILAQRFIHPDDIAGYIAQATSSQALQCFRQNEHTVVLEYRRRFPTGDYRWVRSVTNLVQDTKNRHIKGFTYVKDIDVQKQAELELRHRAERDPLTGLYNKTMTQNTIAACLVGDYPVGALFVIDVDNFKTINDYLGHAYGDVVLCELAEKLQKLFQHEDIVGRIGGDEFMAFMKNIPDLAAVQLRVEEILRAFYNSYRGEDDLEYIVSASVGVAICPKDGRRFEELFRNADIALYTAKNNGKNTFALFDGQMFPGYASNRTAIDAHGDTQQKSFKENRVEFVFKILYDADNQMTAIRSVLELMTRHFYFDRGYIFETDPDGTTTSNTVEWCAEGVQPQMEYLQKVPICMVETANASFMHSGMFILHSLSLLPAEERAVLEPQGIKSMFQFGIFEHGRLLGFLGFDNCRDERAPSPSQQSDMLTICNILATFFVKQHSIDRSAKLLAVLTAVMDKLNSYTYIVNKDTMALLFMNQKTAQAVGFSEVGHGQACYRVFRGNETQCVDCPIRGLTDDPDSLSSLEIHNDKFHIWTESTASYLHWIDGQTACLINCVDITKHKTNIENRLDVGK